MKRVTSIGGVFFKSKQPEKIREWYQKHLGLQVDNYGTTFEWRQADNPTKMGFTQWSPMKEDTTYFEPSAKEFMVNYRVENLELLVSTLKEEGVVFIDEIESFEYGKFIHLMDPEGTKIELWEPNDEAYNEILTVKTR